MIYSHWLQIDVIIIIIIIIITRLFSVWDITPYPQQFIVH